MKDKIIKVTFISMFFIMFEMQLVFAQPMNFTIKSQNSDVCLSNSFDYQSEKQDAKKQRQHIPNLRINMEYGYGYRHPKISQDVSSLPRKYYDDLKSGTSINTDITYFHSNSWGWGIRYTLLKTSNQMDNVTLVDENGNSLGPGIIKDNISYFTIGPALFYRVWSPNHRVILTSSFSIGYIRYKADSKYLGVPILAKGSNFSHAGCSVSADFLISSNIAVGVSIAYITGAMDKVDVNGEDVDLSEKENLNRLDASGGLKFFFMMPD